MILTDLTFTAATTGTAGNTLTTAGESIIILGTGIFPIGIIALLFIIAHLLDLKYSRPSFDKACRLKEEEEAHNKENLM